jgi:hypothetical protein
MSTPRKHHYVPKFYLKGFTKEATVDGKLWVIDLEKRKVWQSSPINSAVEVDFYAGDLGPDVDPMWLEKALGEQVEPLMAQVLEFILDTRSIPPCGQAYDIFLNLLATSLVRGQTMRMTNSKVFDLELKRLIREKGQSGPIQCPSVFQEHTDSFQFDFDRITHLKAMLRQTQAALELMSLRDWTVRVVAEDVPDLICSESPVGLVPLAEQVPDVWLDPNALVVMPLNRRVVVIGMLTECPLPEYVDLRLLAHINAATTRGTNQVYCSEPHFATFHRNKFARVEFPT